MISKDFISMRKTMVEHDLSFLLNKLFGENYSAAQKEQFISSIKNSEDKNFLPLDQLSSYSEDDDQLKISSTFSKEWEKYDDILPEYQNEFDNYFDIVPDDIFNESEYVADIGCGKGRWSKEFLKKNSSAKVILIDPSDAIYVAKKNLKEYSNRILFIKADITKIKLMPKCFDFIFSLGVIHHIPGNLQENLKQVVSLSNKNLIYLYYSLDNRGNLYKLIFSLVNFLRMNLSKITNEGVRSILVKFLMIFLYLPIIFFIKLLNFFELETSRIPLNYYANNLSITRIEQDVYDRFFTHIEKRISRKEIMHFAKENDFDINVSEIQPFWHFFLSRK